MGRSKAPVAEDLLEVAVGGSTIKVMSRLADNNQLARLLALEPNEDWAATRPLTGEGVAEVVRAPIAPGSRKRRSLHVLNGSAPAATPVTPAEPEVRLVAVEPLAFSLPGTPDGLVVQMDERGDGHLYSVGEDRVRLGADGMWWIVTRLIEALEDPQTISTRPRFLTVSGFLGGPAVQASLQYNDAGVCVVWRRLDSGVIGEVISWQELSHGRAEGWLNMLRPILLELERREVHHRRLLPARTAERWAVAIERWSA